MKIHQERRRLDVTNSGLSGSLFDEVNGNEVVDLHAAWPKQEKAPEAGAT